MLVLLIIDDLVCYTAASLQDLRYQMHDQGLALNYKNTIVMLIIADRKVEKEENKNKLVILYKYQITS